MTGGSVVVLGNTGNNFGAGMTGGLAFVYDKNRLFKNKINMQSVEIQSPIDSQYKKHQNYLLGLLKSHYKETGSLVTKEIIKNFKEEIGNFMMVKPKDSDFKDLLMILTKAA